ncbi:DUF1129 family protein [Bacillus kexueae]|uniref:DUF1129 family protein n=1 Tax=Aeribacillus kexueae TaxID=2078952 RepID=UPI001FAE8A97|nr:DUF1129 family protein [Bacillus kexueae]
MMMQARDLISLNNDKRKLLSEQNESYYSKMLIYIRFHLFLSEQQSEEILMELLDHLIEAQEKGKSAEEVFGHDPKAYCDELIQNLATEKRKNVLKFTTYLLLMIAGIHLLIEGLFEIATENFEQAVNSYYTGSVMASFVIGLISTALTVYFIFNWLKRSAFNEATSHVKDALFIFAVASFGMGGILLGGKLIPPFGPIFHMSNYVVLVIGIILLMIVFVINKMERITK